MKLSWSIFLIVVTLPFLALANEPIPVDVDAIRVDGIQATDLQEAPSSMASEAELVLTYDPSLLQEASKVEIDYDSLIKLSDTMVTPGYQALLENKIQIPVSTASSKGLQRVKNLTPEELTIFLSKKTMFLEKVAKTLNFLRLKPKTINKMINVMNDSFFQNAAVIANSNRHIYTIQLGVSGGVGFSDWIMAQLKKSPYFKNLPERSGFYFLAGGGLSLVVTKTPEGKSKISIEPVLEFRRSTRIFSPFVFGAAGLQAGYFWENGSQRKTLQTASFYKFSMVNVINGGETFGFNAAAAAVFPPGGGAISGIEGKIYRLRLTPEIFGNLWKNIRQFRLRGVRLRCESIFL